jgi:hypothetical protein
MRLAEALSQRKDWGNRLGRDYAERALDVLTYEEDGAEAAPTPAEAQALLDEVTDLASDIADASIAINRVNNATSVVIDGDTITMMEAISRRDALAREIAAINAIINNVESAVGSGQHRRYRGHRSKDDVVLKLVLPLSQLRSRLDGRQAALRRLDTEIQKVNWTVDLP